MGFERREKHRKFVNAETPHKLRGAEPPEQKLRPLLQIEKDGIMGLPPYPEEAQDPKSDFVLAPKLPPRRYTRRHAVAHYQRARCPINEPQPPELGRNPQAD